MRLRTLVLFYHLFFFSGHDQPLEMFPISVREVNGLHLPSISPLALLVGYRWRWVLVILGLGSTIFCLNRLAGGGGLKTWYSGMGA